MDTLKHTVPRLHEMSESEIAGERNNEAELNSSDNEIHIKFLMNFPLQWTGEWVK